MNDNKKINELLNAYMDGELDQRRQTEVKRLIQHDAEVARQLSEMIKMRGLVGAIPQASPPRDFVENVKSRLEHKSMVGSYNDYSDTDEGVKQLFWRRAISIAAIVMLTLVLGGVIFNIVGLQPADSGQVISENWINKEIEPVRNTKETIAAAPVDETVTTADKKIETAAATREVMPERLTATLELNTANFAGVDAFVKRALVDNGIVLIELPVSETENGVYNIHCSRNKAMTLIADLATIWDKFESATLRVDTGVPGRDVAVANVRPRQISDIIAESQVSKAIELARSTASLNAMTREMPSMLATETDVDSLPIPKPVLTSSEARMSQPEKVEDKEMVELVIVIKVKAKN